MQRGVGFSLVAAWGSSSGRMGWAEVDLFCRIEGAESRLGKSTEVHILVNC